MNIFIDESGSFVCADHGDAWNVVAAYVSPENENNDIKIILTKLKVSCAKTFRDEIKLKDINEDDYLAFLDRLGRLSGLYFAVATDCSLISADDITRHRNIQANKILENRERMIHESGKEMIDEVADKIRNLSPQLYLQLVSQVDLIFTVIQRSVLYFAQRKPVTLRRFCWRVDQKNTTKIEYEETFEQVTPPLLQSKSLRDPFYSVVEFDYNHMEPFFYTEENAPTYLEGVYGIKTNLKGGLNIGKIIWDDMNFEDSKRSNGVQIADLLASGTRRVLRNGFDNNTEVAKRLGRLMVSAGREDEPINLISFIETAVDNDITAKVIREFRANARPMLVERYKKPPTRSPAKTD